MWKPILSVNLIKFDIYLNIIKDIKLDKLKFNYIMSMTGYFSASTCDFIPSGYVCIQFSPYCTLHTYIIVCFD